VPAEIAQAQPRIGQAFCQLTRLRPGHQHVVTAGHDQGFAADTWQLIEDVEGALWTQASIDRARLPVVPSVFDRVVVAVDPPVTGGSAADECGIVVLGVIQRGTPQSWEAVVLEDASVTGASPDGWAQAAIAAYHRHGADRLVAEVNQGGDLVERVIRQVDPLVAYRAVRASRGKHVRAEPVAALYEQGRVKHAPGLVRLEDQMLQMSVQGYQGKGSPDRVDALVWALTEGIIDRAQAWANPRVRGL
jgi:phage terminase large subunit-like protein